MRHKNTALSQLPPFFQVRHKNSALSQLPPFFQMRHKNAALSQLPFIKRLPNFEYLLKQAQFSVILIFKIIVSKALKHCLVIGKAHVCVFVIMYFFLVRNVCVRLCVCDC